MHFFRLGGLEELVARLSLAYQSQGYTPVVMGFEPGPLQEELEQKGIRTLLLQKPPGVRPEYATRLARCFVQERLDCLHTHHLGPLVYGVPGAWLSQTPVVHTVHSNEHLQPNSPRRNRWAFQALIRGTRALTTVNEELKVFLEQNFPHPRIQVIQNGVHQEQFHGNYDRQAKLAELEIPQDLPVLGIVARLEEEKGHRFLLEALALLEHPVRLLVVGTGGQKEALMQQADALGVAERVSWLGLRRDIPALLSVLDLFVLPSLREGLPLALLEALASGVPAVVSSVGGMPRLIEQSGGGRCVPPKDPQALASVISTLLDDEDTRQTLAHQGQKWVHAHCTQKVMVQRYLDLYRWAQEVPSRGIPLLKSFRGWFS